MSTYDPAQSNSYACFIIFLLIWHCNDNLFPWILECVCTTNKIVLKWDANEHTDPSCMFTHAWGCIVCVCVMCRDYRSGTRVSESNRNREYPLSRLKSEEGSLPVSRHNSRPPTRSGSHPSTADSLRHSIGGWMLFTFRISFPNTKYGIIRIWKKRKGKPYALVIFKMHWLFFFQMFAVRVLIIQFVNTGNQLHIFRTI